MVPPQYLLCQRTFSGATHQQAYGYMIQTDAGDGPCCWPGSLFPFASGFSSTCSQWPWWTQPAEYGLYLNAAGVPQWREPCGSCREEAWGTGSNSRELSQQISVSELCQKHQSLFLQLMYHALVMSAQPRDGQEGPGPAILRQQEQAQAWCLEGTSTGEPWGPVCSLPAEELPWQF